MTGVEKAMALDLLDESPIDRLFEDENGIFIPEADGAEDDDPTYMPEFWGWLRGIES